MIGGVACETKQLLDTIEVLDLVKSEWSSLSIRLLSPLKCFNAVSLPEGILIIGGQNNKAIS